VLGGGFAFALGGVFLGRYGDYGTLTQKAHTGIGGWL
jgi:hypothetical protein